MTHRPIALRKYGDTNFITGMRAYAALAVVLIHAGGAGLRSLGTLGNHLADMGHTGVYVFFVISGFSVANSYTGSASYGHYLLRRIWRIAPLYYFWLLVTAAFTQGVNYWGQRFGVDLDWHNALVHALFLGFADFRVSNSIIGTEWSIPVEVFWYVAVPALVTAIQKRWLSIPLLLAIGVAAYAATCELPGLLPLPRDVADIAVQWSPLPYFFSYCLGVSAFELRKSTPPTRAQWPVVSALALPIAYAFWPAAFQSAHVGDYLVTSLATFLLIWRGSTSNSLCRALFENRLALFLGSISYGIYLSHMPILMALDRLLPNLPAPLAFAVAAAAAIAVSGITYYTIEIPMEAFGKRLWPSGKPATRPASTPLR